jgi:hypothetical protein
MRYPLHSIGPASLPVFLPFSFPPSSFSFSLLKSLLVHPFVPLPSSLIPHHSFSPSLPSNPSPACGGGRGRSHHCGGRAAGAGRKGGGLRRRDARYVANPRLFSFPLSICTSLFSFLFPSSFGLFSSLFALFSSSFAFFSPRYLSYFLPPTSLIHRIRHPHIL